MSPSMSKAVIYSPVQEHNQSGWVKTSSSNTPAKNLFEQADQALGFSQFHHVRGLEELTKTSCQPALYLHGLTCLALLKEKIPAFTATAAAGLSLGEFTAHAAAGTFSFETGLNIVMQRGQFMEEACNSTEGAMAAMIGGDPANVEALAAESGVDVANFNAPGQIVLSGTIEGIDKAVANAKSKGIKLAKELDVAGYTTPA